MFCLTPDKAKSLTLKFKVFYSLAEFFDNVFLFSVNLLQAGEIGDGFGDGELVWDGDDNGKKAIVDVFLRAEENVDESHLEEPSEQQFEESEKQVAEVNGGWFLFRV